MFEFLEITAQYSNAVLVAILPHVADFAKTLELPVAHPITASHVQFFGCFSRSDHIGGHVLLTNGYQFTFDRGRVALYRSPRSYFSLQDPNRIPEFYGSLKTSKQEALGLARAAVRNLGYSEAQLFTDREPEVTEPPKSGTNTVPHYRFRWLRPDSAPGSLSSASVNIEVDGCTGQIQMLALLDKNSWRPDPHVDVPAPAIKKGPQTTYAGGRKVSPVSAIFSNAFLISIMPQISDYVRKAGFSVRLPVTTNDVDLSRYDCGLVDDDPRAFLYLKSGERVVYRHGQVICFEERDAVRLPENANLPPHRFYGPVNMTSDEAISLVRKTIVRLGYSLNILHLDTPPVVVPPRKDGTNVFARYFIRWQDRKQGVFFAVAEVDAASKRLKALYINDHANTNIWREPPNADKGVDEAKRSRN